MEKLKFFIDTHDKANETFPAEIGPQELALFYKSYNKSCEEEGVIPVKTLVGFKEGKGFCLNMAPNKEAVERAHRKVGLPYDSITEVESISPTDLLLS